MREIYPFKLWLLLKGHKLDASVYILYFLFLCLPEIFYFCSVEAIEKPWKHVVEIWVVSVVICCNYSISLSFLEALSAFQKEIRKPDWTESSQKNFPPLCTFNKYDLHFKNYICCLVLCKNNTCSLQDILAINKERRQKNHLSRVTSKDPHPTFWFASF